MQSSIMSQGNFPIQPKNKNSRNSLLRDSNCKLQPSSSCLSHIATENSQNHKAGVSEDSKNVFNLRKSSKHISKTISNANLSARKLWNDASKTSKNSIYVPAVNVIEEESEVISVLTKQLCLAESQMRKMQSIMTKTEEGLRTKEQEIVRLKRKIKDWENKYKSQELSHKKERRTQIKNSEYFYQRCLTLEHKISEMERFLADYGLVWVDDTKDPTEADNVSNNYIDTCYDQLLANIDQLNLTAGKGEVHVHRDEKGATFKTFTCMELKFYKNGMTVQGGSLRSYGDPTARAFIRDILDGYFPSELQQEYPDGVPFMIEDHRRELYAANSAGFPGQGYRLGKQSPVDNSLSTSSRKSNNTSQKSDCISPSSRDNAWESQSIPLLSLPTSRSSKSKESSEASSVNLPSLRSHILASHNNVCSDSHIQSHINAELVRRSRREKKELPTKNIEYGMSSREISLKRDVSRSLSRTGHHSSTDRSLTKFSSNRPKSVGNRLRLRPRSLSLSGGRIVNIQSLQAKTLSTSEINNTNQLNIAKSFIVESSATKRPHVTKSTTCAKKSSPPLLHLINEATGRPGELRLKIRSLSGSTVYLVHISIDESVAKLYDLLDKAMKESGYKGYKVLLNGYSPKKLERVDVSLKECGINRDCVLHLMND